MAFSYSVFLPCPLNTSPLYCSLDREPLASIPGGGVVHRNGQLNPFSLENQARILKQNQFIQQPFCHNSQGRRWLQGWGKSKACQGKMSLEWDLLTCSLTVNVLFLSCVFSIFKCRKRFCNLLWRTASPSAALTCNVWVSSPELPLEAVSATDALHMQEKHVFVQEWSTLAFKTFNWLSIGHATYEFIVPHMTEKA